MKQLLSLCIAISCSICALAQEYAPNFTSESKAFKFQESQTEGLLVKTEMFDTKEVKCTGGVGSDYLRLTPVIVSDIRGDTRIAFIRVTLAQGSGINYSYYSSSIDYDEIPACLDALTYLREEEVPKKPSNYTAINITTRDGLKLGVYYQYEVWQGKLTHTKYLSEPTTLLKIKQFDELTNILKEQEALLKSKL